MGDGVALEAILQDFHELENTNDEKTIIVYGAFWGESRLTHVPMEFSSSGSHTLLPGHNIDT